MFLHQIAIGPGDFNGWYSCRAVKTSPKIDQIRVFSPPMICDGFSDRDQIRGFQIQRDDNEITAMDPAGNRSDPGSLFFFVAWKTIRSGDLRWFALGSFNFVRAAPVYSHDIIKYWTRSCDNWIMLHCTSLTSIGPFEQNNSYKALFERLLKWADRSKAITALQKVPICIYSLLRAILSIKNHIWGHKSAPK